jgi:hypothetical protein
VPGLGSLLLKNKKDAFSAISYLSFLERYAKIRSLGFEKGKDFLSFPKSTQNQVKDFLFEASTSCSKTSRFFSFKGNFVFTKAKPVCLKSLKRKTLFGTFKREQPFKR